MLLKNQLEILRLDLRSRPPEGFNSRIQASKSQTGAFQTAKATGPRFSSTWKTLILPTIKLE